MKKIIKLKQDHLANGISSKDDGIIQRIESTSLPPAVEKEVANQLDAIPELEQIIFHKNTAYDFLTKENFDTNIKTKYNLQEGVDYQVLQNDFITSINGELKVVNGDFANRQPFTLCGSSGGGFNKAKMGVNGNQVVEWGGANWSNTYGSMYYSHKVDLSQAILERGGDHYFVKFLRDIIRKAYIKADAVNGRKYTGIDGVLVDNTLNIIKLDPTIKTKIDNNSDNIENDILPNLQENTLRIQELDTKISNIKSLDSLVNGDNVLLQKQGDETFINTTDDLKLKSLTSRDGNPIEVQSPVHFNKTPHIKQSLIIDNENLNISSEIAMLDNDLKLINGSGYFLFGDKDGVINTRTLKNNQDKIISDLGDTLLWKKKGTWNTQTTYQRYDVVDHKGNSYWLDKDSSIGEEPTPKNSFWINLMPTTTDGYSKAEIDNKFDTTNQNVASNTSGINQLNLKHQLVNQRLDSIQNNQEFITANGNQWEESLVFAELNPSSPDKTKFNLKPSTLKEYQLKSDLIQLETRVKALEKTFNSFINSNTETRIHTQGFRGVESKGSENRVGYSFYGYDPNEFTTPIPLAIQVGVATFGNIFGVDYNEWDGIEYNGVLIAWNTTTTIGDLTIDLRNNQFQANKPLVSIILYKKVVGAINE